MGAVLISRREHHFDTSPLKQARLDKGWSLRTAGVKTGLSYVTLARIEKGCRVEEETIKKLCAVYGLDYSVLEKSFSICENS